MPATLNNVPINDGDTFTLAADKPSVIACAAGGTLHLPNGLTKWVKPEKTLSLEAGEYGFSEGGQPYKRFKVITLPATAPTPAKPAKINGQTVPNGSRNAAIPGPWDIETSGKLSVRVVGTGGNPLLWNAGGIGIFTPTAGTCYAISWDGGYAEVLAILPAPELKIRLAGAVLPWKLPDWTPTEKAALLKSAGASMYGRWYIGIKPDTDAAAKAKTAKAHADAGILPVLTFHWSETWTDAKAIAAKILAIAPAGSIVQLLNEVNLSQYWKKTVRDAIEAAHAVAQELRKLGRSEISSPSLTTPPPTLAQSYCDAIKEVDTDRVFNWIDVHSYSADPKYVRDFVGVYRQFCDSTARKLLSTEWGLLNPNVNPTSFAKIAPEIIPQCDLSCVWLLAESTDDGTTWHDAIALLDRSGNETAYMPAWRSVTGQPNPKPVYPFLSYTEGTPAAQANWPKQFTAGTRETYVVKSDGTITDAQARLKAKPASAAFAWLDHARPADERYDPKNPGYIAAWKAWLSNFPRMGVYGLTPAPSPSFGWSDAASVQALDAIDDAISRELLPLVSHSLIRCYVDYPAGNYDYPAHVARLMQRATTRRDKFAPGTQVIAVLNPRRVDSGEWVPMDVWKAMAQAARVADGVMVWDASPDDLMAQGMAYLAAVVEAVK